MYYFSFVFSLQEFYDNVSGFGILCFLSCFRFALPPEPTDPCLLTNLRHNEELFLQILFWITPFLLCFWNSDNLKLILSFRVPEMLFLPLPTLVLPPHFPHWTISIYLEALLLFSVFYCLHCTIVSFQWDLTLVIVLFHFQTSILFFIRSFVSLMRPWWLPEHLSFLDVFNNRCYKNFFK